MWLWFFFCLHFFKIFARATPILQTFLWFTNTKGGTRVKQVPPLEESLTITWYPVITVFHSMIDDHWSLIANAQILIKAVAQEVKRLVINCRFVMFDPRLLSKVLNWRYQLLLVAKCLHQCLAWQLVAVWVVWMDEWDANYSVLYIKTLYCWSWLTYTPPPL